MQQDLIRDLLARRDLERLRLIPSHEIGSHLVNVIRQEESAAEPPNFDKLMSTGVLLAKTGHEDVDEAVLYWLLDNPSAERLNMVAAFLIGLWNRRLRDYPVPAQSVRSLIKAREGLTLDEDTEYTYIQALSQIMRSDAEPSLKDEVRAILQNLLQRDFSPPLDELAKLVIEQALK